MRKLALCLLFCAPLAVHASAVRICKVTAVVKELKGTPEKPVLSIEIKSASFEGGHSMGEDCSEFTRFNEREIELRSSLKTAVGRTILLLVTQVRSITEKGPVASESWEVHADYKP